jgi:hypothetical protein
MASVDEGTRVESEARAIEIAARISKAADAAMEIRQCVDAPPDSG